MILTWFSEFDPKGFGAVGEYFEGAPPDVSLAQLLDFDSKNLKPFSRDLLDIDNLPQNFSASFAELRWGIRAYLQFQDVLNYTFTIDANMKSSIKFDASTFFNRHYCYYESLVYLRESVVSWLDRNVLAALTLLRPFLELSIFHLYWYLTSESENYKSYYEWLKSEGSKGKPGLTKAIGVVFDKLPTKGWVEGKRLDELKQVIKNLYRGLCAYNHTPKLDESIAAKSGGLGNVAYESFLYALYTTNILLRQIVYLFILAYPMSMFPVAGYKKWGFSGPVGSFFDRCNFGHGSRPGFLP
jgi:hypothetical protein